MNKDLAAVTAVWRALFGVRNRCLGCFICVFVVLLSKSRRRCFAADSGSVSGDGCALRCCTVGELLRDWDCVSVMRVQEVCDEKRYGVGWRRRSWRVDQLRIAVGENGAILRKEKIYR